MKREWNKSGMKQIVHSGLHIFDDQTNCLDWDGNCVSNTQISYLIRPFSEVACNGISFAPGVLQQADVRMMPSYLVPCRDTLKCISQHGKEEMLWWSSFFYRSRSKPSPTVLCSCVASEKEIHAFSHLYTVARQNQRDCIDFCIDYVTQGREEQQGTLIPVKRHFDYFR